MTEQLQGEDQAGPLVVPPLVLQFFQFVHKFEDSQHFAALTQSGFEESSVEEVDRPLRPA